MNPILNQAIIRVVEVDNNSKKLEKELDDKKSKLEEFEVMSNEHLHLVKKDIMLYQEKIGKIKTEVLELISKVQKKGKIEDLNKLRNQINNLQLEKRASFNDLKKKVEKLKKTFKQI